MNDVEFIKHPLIKSDTVEQRLYQLSLAGEAIKKSSLIVLPTGLGKTIVALLVMVSRLPKGKYCFFPRQNRLWNSMHLFSRIPLIFLLKTLYCLLEIQILASGKVCMRKHS